MVAALIRRKGKGRGKEPKQATREPQQYRHPLDGCLRCSGGIAAERNAIQMHHQGCPPEERGGEQVPQLRHRQGKAADPLDHSQSRRAARAAGRHAHQALPAVGARLCRGRYRGPLHRQQTVTPPGPVHLEDLHGNDRRWQTLVSMVRHWAGNSWLRRALER